ncbi:15-cis-phytoene synthase [Litoreibacter roseus]|uniref:Phytoene synthase n=1 Tax=Litoreibacter roseus TaxID=2601869 RepID=A0A6N6JEP0_9RHOB|nr:phytoene/squalene synthase family protein [Litoreibacter roseus]GFE64605.1 phytoene synthase [Litoreibacter roseus]
MIPAADLAHCRAAIRTGSRSFFAASHLLPARVRDPALALYTFCRLADDAVDLHREKAQAVAALRDRLELAYAKTPRDAPADRAFAAMISDHEMPRELPEALLEGLAWDAAGRDYETLSDVRAYSARVAAAVGAMMTVLMGVRDADALARACDLGVAMQLTNIARDVGEDAVEGRLYLPRQMMEDEGLDPDDFLAAPKPSAALGRVTRRLLREAQRLYHRSEPGISALPLSCRPGIFAARHIYDGIGQQVRRNQYDSFSQRARTNKWQKTAWLMQSVLRTGVTCAMPQSAVLFAAPLPEVEFLVTAAAIDQDRRQPRAAAVIDVFAQLEARDRLGA